MSGKKQIAVLTEGFLNWRGGVDFLTTCITALLASADTEKVDITLVLPEKKFFSAKQRLLLRLPFIKQKLFRRKSQTDPWLSSFKHNRFHFIRFRRKELTRFLKKIDTATFCWSDTPIHGCRSVGYYPDLQHCYYPQYFTPEECANRDATITKILQTRQAIYVNALAVKNDLEKFYPPSPCAIVSLPFAPILTDTEWLNPLSYDVQEKFSIPSPYFIISNQFWIHKDHKTAFAALRQLPAHVHLVCTGPQNDFRFPKYFDELRASIDKLGLTNRVHFLGLIPKREQVELMKGAVAVIQPTLFEGGPGGGSAQTAITLGVPVIASDIAVNKEMRCGDVRFFATGQSEDLAHHMASILETEPSRPTKNSLLQKREDAIHKLGRALLEAT